MDELAFLDKFIFHGLEDINDGFDSAQIRYFSESDFRIVLERVEKLNIVIHGIEPWKDDTHYDILSSSDFGLKETDSEWYWKAYQQFIDSGENLKYAASYHVPKHLIEEMKNS